jgi:hypothetical protein
MAPWRPAAGKSTLRGMDVISRAPTDKTGEPLRMGTGGKTLRHALQDDTREIILTTRDRRLRSRPGA